MSANIQINSYIRVIRTIIYLRGGQPHPQTTVDLLSSPAGPSPDPSPEGKGSDYRDTPIGLLTRSLGSFFSHTGEVFLSQRSQSSLSIFAHSFEPTEGLRHTEFTERYC